MEMFVPIWIIAVIGSVAWLAVGIGMTKLYAKLVNADVSYAAPFLVFIWPVIILAVVVGLFAELTDRIFATDSRK